MQVNIRVDSSEFDIVLYCSYWLQCAFDLLSIPPLLISFNLLFYHLNVIELDISGYIISHL